MKKPVLVIMAAGMGSRYGGLKQIDPIDDMGHIIMDYSIYDAREAGFEKVIFIIKKENEKLFRECIGDRISETMEVEYVFQELDDLPEGYTVPEGRVKPWGTGHAVLSARDIVDGSFAVINADDYYGASAFHQIYHYLSTHEDDEKYRYTMVGYLLKNTVTDNGYVSRGVCDTDASGNLTGINERTRIEKRETPEGKDGIAYTEDDGKTWTFVDPDTTVSMNMWGFTGSMMQELKCAFEAFQKDTVPGNPAKAEFYLPSVASDLVKAGKAEVRVLTSEDKWYGVTYQEDKPEVVAALKQLCDSGKYKF